MASTAEQIYQALPDLVRGGSLDKTVYAGEFGAAKTNKFYSENHGCLAVAADGLNALNGNPSYWTARQNADWAKRVFFVRHQRVGFCGHEFNSGIYLRYIVESVLAFWYLGKKLGDIELVALCEDWLRGYMFHSALFALPVPPRSPASKEWWGPGVLVAKSPPSTEYRNAYATGDCGFRSHEHQLANLAVQNGRGILLAEILGAPSASQPPAPDKRQSRSEMTSTLRSRASFEWPITAGESTLMHRCTRNDPSAMREILALCGLWKTYKPYRLLRFEDGVVTVLEEFGGSSTQPTEVKRLDADGVVRVLSCGQGWRKSAGQPDAVRASTAVVDLAAREVRAARLDGAGGTQVLPFPSGELLFHVQFGSADAVEIGSSSIPPEISQPEPEQPAAPPSTPAPPAENPARPDGNFADFFDWFANADKLRACVGPTYYCTISPLVGFPHLFASRLSSGPNPWSTGIFYVDPATSRVYNCVETTYTTQKDVNDGIATRVGEPVVIRTFWRREGTGFALGIERSPRWINRDQPTSRTVSGALVEHRLIDGGEAMPVNAATKRAGDIFNDKVVAQVKIEHLEVNGQIGSPVARVRFTDTMGLDKPNVEVYEWGFNGDGAYGIIKWDRWERGVYIRGHAADRTEPAGAGCLVYGVDPLDPELRDRWFATPGFSGEVPPPGSPTERRGLAGVSVGGGKTPEKGGGCGKMVLIGLGALLSAGAALAVMLG